MSGLSRRQLALRKDSIGGSAIAALAGLSRWATPIELYESMVHGTEKESTLAMRLGTALEDPVAELYAEETGRWLRRVDTCRHPVKAFAIATPDRAVFALPVAALAKKKLLEREQLVDAERLLEVKTTTWRLAEEWGPEGTDEIPEHHLCQVQWTLGVTGKQFADVVVLFDRDRTARYTVRFSEELFSGLLEIGERFLVDHVQKGVPPPPDASDRYGEFLARRFPAEQPGQLLVMTEAQLELTKRFAWLKEAERRLELLAKEAGNQLRSEIGGNEGLVMGPIKATWKKTKDSTKTNWEGAAGEALQLAERLLSGAPGDVGQAKSQLATLVGRWTSTKPGHRRLLLSKELTQFLATEHLVLGLPVKSTDSQGEAP
jgi:putative phage-type endonuclease